MRYEHNKNKRNNKGNIESINTPIQTHEISPFKGLIFRLCALIPQRHVKRLERQEMALFQVLKYLYIRSV